MRWRQAAWVATSILSAGNAIAGSLPDTGVAFEPCQAPFASDTSAAALAAALGMDVFPDPAASKGEAATTVTIEDHSVDVVWRNKSLSGIKAVTIRRLVSSGRVGVLAVLSPEGRLSVAGVEIAASAKDVEAKNGRPFMLQTQGNKLVATDWNGGALRKTPNCSLSIEFQSRKSPDYQWPREKLRSDDPRLQQYDVRVEAIQFGPSPLSPP